MEGMLSGITVIDLTRNLVGPFCTMTLADMGARVIKIEIPPDGDDTRKAGPFINRESAYFLSVNRGKQSLTLNIKEPEGKEIFKKLVEKGDILVENNRPGVMKRLGLTYEVVSKINPGLIYASVSGFGQYGPYSEKGAYDVVIQGYGGVMSITGFPGGKPVRVGYSVADLGAALYTVIGILGSLQVRNETGKGQYIDISMLDCQAALLENAIVRYTTTGNIPQPEGSKHPVFAPFQAFEAENGYFILAVANDRLFRIMCDAIQRSDIYEDNRFSTNPMRVDNVGELDRILTEVFKTKPKEHWIDLFENAGVPTGPVSNVKDVVDSPQIEAREMVVAVEHPIAGKVRIAGSPIKASLTSGAVQGPAPVLGQHTEEILKTLDYDDTTIGRFREKGII